MSKSLTQRLRYYIVTRGSTRFIYVCTHSFNLLLGIVMLVFYINVDTILLSGENMFYMTNLTQKLLYKL